MSKHIEVDQSLPGASGPGEQPGSVASAAAGRTAQPPDGPAHGSVPRLVIRGKSWFGVDPETGEKILAVPRGHRGEFFFIPVPDERAHPHSAITDWLNFTFPFKPSKDRLGEFFPRLFGALSKKFSPAVERPLGKHAYERSYQLGETKALFACGGNRDTALVSLNGDACALVHDWAAAMEFGERELRGRITRWDGAVDDYLGKHSVDGAISLYTEGLFGAGGRLPKLRQYGNWLSPDGSGRSVEIGNRKNGKRLLVYEKSMQLGAKFHPWTRWELSLGNHNREIPWSVLLQPGQYVAGAYPKALAWVREEMSRIATLQKQTQISYEHGVKHGSLQVGRLINVMLQVEGSPERVVEMLIRPGHPRRLQHPAVENPEGWIE